MRKYIDYMFIFYLVKNYIQKKISLLYKFTIFKELKK